MFGPLSSAHSRATALLRVSSVVVIWMCAPHPPSNAHMQHVSIAGPVLAEGGGSVELRFCYLTKVWA